MSTTIKNNRLLAAALSYAELGYRIFPCVPGTKVPLTEHGFLDATTDEKQMRIWETGKHLVESCDQFCDALVLDQSPDEANHRCIGRKIKLVSKG